MNEQLIKRFVLEDANAEYQQLVLRKFEDIDKLLLEWYNPSNKTNNPKDNADNKWVVSKATAEKVFEALNFLRSYYFDSIKVANERVERAEKRIEELEKLLMDDGK